MRAFKRILYLFLLCFTAGSIHAQSVGGTTSGAATYCSSTNSGFISVTGYTGSILNWESSTDGGATWSNVSNTTPAQSYFNLSQSTCYRAIVQNGAFPPDTSTTACITVYLPSNGGSISGGGTFCAGSGSGTLTLSGNTGNPIFWQFSTDNGVTWTSVSNTTTSLSYSSITVNTIYEAVVQNGPTCPTDTSTQASFIIDAMSVAGTLSGSDTVCTGTNGGTLNLSGMTGSVIGWAYSTDNGTTWTPILNSSTSQSYSNLTQTTLYSAIVQNNSCPADISAPATILVNSLPLVSAGTDTTIAAGASVQLNGSGTGTPLWTPSAGLDSISSFTPNATPAATTTYLLTVVDVNGCTASDNVTVTVILPEFNGMVSNLINPNGDGINGSWYIEGIENFQDSEVYVYNIYGNKVFEKKNYKNDWKGTYNGAALPDGTYYYILKFGDTGKPIKGSLDILSNK